MVYPSFSRDIRRELGRPFPGKRRSKTSVLREGKAQRRRNVDVPRLLCAKFGLVRKGRRSMKAHYVGKGKLQRGVTLPRVTIASSCSQTYIALIHADDGDG